MPSRKLAMMRWHHTDESVCATSANLQFPSAPALNRSKSRTVESWLSTFRVEVEKLRMPPRVDAGAARQQTVKPRPEEAVLLKVLCLSLGLGSFRVARD